MKTLVACIETGLVAGLVTVTPSRLRPRLTAKRWQAFARALISSIFIASLIHAWPALVAPLDLPMRTFVVNVASHLPSPADSAQQATPWQQTAIIKLDGEYFRSVYRGEQPLHRCALLDDLGRLLGTSQLLMLAIDFDLSPSTRRALGDSALQPQHPAAQPAGAEAGTCDKQLDALLIENKHRLRLILPLDRAPNMAAGPLEMRERAAVEKWLSEMTGSGLRFARPELDLQFGMVRHHRPQDEPSLGVALAQGICERQPSAPQPQPHTAYCDGVKALAVAIKRSGAAPIKPRQISVHWLSSLFREGRALSLGPDIADELAAKGIRYALLGSGYSADDVVLTPVGKLDGVSVHAAVAANPNESPSDGLGLALDIALGVGFAWLVHFFWYRYYGKPGATARRGNPQPNLQLNYLWLVGLAAIAAVLAIMLSICSLYALVRWQLWVSPAGMLAGVLLDAFVTGGVHEAHQALHPSAETTAPERSITQPTTQPWWQTGSQRLFGAVPSIVWLWVVVGQPLVWYQQ